jgi:hypothetical protein
MLDLLTHMQNYERLQDGNNKLKQNTVRSFMASSMLLYNAAK